MQPRRIALVTETFYPATDGTTTTLKHLADHLIAPWTNRGRRFEQHWSPFAPISCT